MAYGYNRYSVVMVMMVMVLFFGDLGAFQFLSDATSYSCLGNCERHADRPGRMMVWNASGMVMFSRLKPWKTSFGFNFVQDSRLVICNLLICLSDFDLSAD